MKKKLETEEGKKIYSLRKTIVEPVIGNIKYNLGFTEFLVKGLDGAKLELNIASIVHNLKKIWAARGRISKNNETIVFDLIINNNQMNCDPTCLGWGGSLLRPEATGYGAVYFALKMLESRERDLQDKVCVVSGSGNVAIHTIKKLKEKIRLYRIEGLKHKGEYSYENLVFKELRNLGYVDKLKDYADKVIDKKISYDND